MLSPGIASTCRVLGCVLFISSFLAALAPAQTVGGSAFTVLRTFTRATDGAGPQTSRLIQASDGLIYGARSTGGSSNGGTVFRVATDGTGFLVLRHFISADGGNPVALLQSRDGQLYGVCHATGATPSASIFRMALDGSGFTVLRRFSGTTDSWLPDVLIEGTDGVLYGAAKAALSLSRAHALFRMHRDGTGYDILRELFYAFDGSDETTLIQGPDGRLYGAALDGGGSPAMGVVFSLNTDGSAFSILKRFQDVEGRRPNRLAIQDGYLYGTTRQGGTADRGVLYRMRIDGSDFTLLHHFRSTFPPAAGEFPAAGVTALRDGNLYGITVFGGSLRGYGTLYRFDLAARRMYFLKQFSWADGVEPATELLAANDGKLYGATGVGGAASVGTLFTYDLTRPGANVGLVGAVGQPFSYTHEFGSSAVGLPNGLTMTTLFGTIAGTPTQAGVFTATISGSLGTGPTSNSVTITVAKGAARITLGSLTPTHDGKPKQPTVTTIPAGLRVVLRYDGSPDAPSAPGSYAVTATVDDVDYAGSTTGTLLIGAGAPRFTEHLANLETNAGQSVTLSPKLTVSPPETYQWQRKLRGDDAFVDLVDNPTFGGVATATLTIRDPRLALSGDQFRLVVTNAAGTATSEPTLLLVRPTVKLTNVAVRARVVPNENLTVGVVTSGQRTLLLRGVGPGLAAFVGREAAGDPTLLVASAANPRLATNDNWSGTATLSGAFAEVGAFALPPDSLDAAVITPLDGAATAQVSVPAAGLVLMEAYDVAGAQHERLVNLSARHSVGADPDALVAGFNVSGSGAITLLIRGVGPALRQFGVGNAIEDPTLQVYQGGTPLAFNDDWESSIGPTARAVGAFALSPGSKDAALLLTISPGSYTIRLANAQNRKGEGLIEIYEVP